MKISTASLFLLTTLVLLTLSDAAQASQCIESPDVPVCAQFWRAKAVFVARAVKVLGTRDDEGSYPEDTLTKLRVRKIYRGEVPQEVFAYMTNGADGLPEYKKGHDYLIYASGFDAATRVVLTSVCIGSRELDKDDEELVELKRLAEGQGQMSLSGRALRYEDEQPLPGLQVILTGNNRSFQTSTDEKGAFTFHPTQSGSYTVRIVIPFEAIVVHYYENIREDDTTEQTVLEYDIELPKGQCDYKEVQIHRMTGLHK
jgi:hypothetical protein